MYEVGPALDWVAKTAKDEDPVFFSVIDGALVLRVPQAVSAQEIREAQAALDKARRFRRPGAAVVSGVPPKLAGSTP